jgi:hypothetical protein
MEKRHIFLDDMIEPIRKYGEECTATGIPRYTFWFGRYKEVDAFALWKFNNHKPVTDPPECVVTSYALRHFIKTAKEVGLHISKAEQRQLEGE